MPVRGPGLSSRLNFQSSERTTNTRCDGPPRSSLLQRFVSALLTVAQLQKRYKALRLHLYNGRQASPRASFCYDGLLHLWRGARRARLTCACLQERCQRNRPPKQSERSDPASTTRGWLPVNIGATRIDQNRWQNPR